MFVLAERQESGYIGALMKQQTVISKGLEGRRKRRKEQECEGWPTLVCEICGMRGFGLELGLELRGFHALGTRAPWLVKPNQTGSNPVRPVKPGQTTVDQGLAGVRTNYGRPALRAARPSRNNQTECFPCAAPLLMNTCNFKL